MAFNCVKVELCMPILLKVYHRITWSCSYVSILLNCKCTLKSKFHESYDSYSEYNLKFEFNSAMNRFDTDRSIDPSINNEGNLITQKMIKRLKVHSINIIQGRKF